LDSRLSFKEIRPGSVRARGLSFVRVDRFEGDDFDLAVKGDGVVSGGIGKWERLLERGIERGASSGDGGNRSAVGNRGALAGAGASFQARGKGMCPLVGGGVVADRIQGVGIAVAPWSPFEE